MVLKGADASWGVSECMLSSPPPKDPIEVDSESSLNKYAFSHPRPNGSI